MKWPAVLPANRMLWTFMLLLVAATCEAPAQKTPPESEVQPRKSSVAARQNPAVRAFFKDRFSQTATFAARIENPDAFEKAEDKTLDNMIDMHTGKVLSLVTTLHEARDKVQASMTPPMLDLLTSSRSVSADAEESSIKAATLLKELMANLKKVATLAGDLDSDLLFLRYALDISLEYKLEKSTLPTKEQIRKDIEAAVTTFPLFEDAVYEFYFPYASSVRLESLKTESVPYLLQKIQKHATRAGDAIRSLEASGKIK